MFKKNAPKTFICSYNSLAVAVKASAKVAFEELPDPEMPEDLVLLPWQQQVWDLIQGEPVRRHIIWVSGDPGSGKSLMVDYMETNFKRGVFNAGRGSSYDSVAYRYMREGVVIWDLPMNYDFDKFGKFLYSAIEKFSDYGQLLSSSKYQGHVVVFANRPCPVCLHHRDIVVINSKVPLKLNQFDSRLV